MNTRRTRLLIALCFLLQAASAGPSSAESSANGLSWNDGTSLLFLGEDTDVLTLASRREESAAKAPAVAQVLTRKDFWDRGDLTLGRVLDQQPGFYMAQKEYGTVPYLRGLPESVLFLYDAVPLRSEVSKSFHPLDQDLSLAAVKRIEIVRGASSVLWGLDAFSGVVNVVPLTGKDLHGVETGLLGAFGEDAYQAYVNAGGSGSGWSAFGSLSFGERDLSSGRASVVRFWDGRDGGPVSPAERFGSDRPETQQTFDFSGNVTLGDGMTFSGRFARSQTPYTLADADRGASWIEERTTEVGHIKADYQKKLSLETSVRASAYYMGLSPESRIIDRSFSPREDTLYGETLMEHALWSGRGLVTAGASYKSTRVRDTLIWKSYFPDYLGSDNTAFLPDLATKDVEHSLGSVFAQYLHKTRSWDAVAGLRADFHNEYENGLNTTLGLIWHPQDDFTMKFLYGTSFRSPSGRQYVEEGSAKELEKARNFSVQLAWKPSERLSGDVTGFYTKIFDHVREDPFAGISLPNDQEVLGVEASARLKILESLSLFGNITALNHSGPDETYRYTEFSILGPGGEREETVVDLTYPFDVGPKTFGNIGLLWSPTKRFSGRMRLRYFSETTLIYPRGTRTHTAPAAWLLDMDALWKNCFLPKLDLTAAVTNALDRDYDIPGTYSMIDGAPLTVHLQLRYRW